MNSKELFATWLTLAPVILAALAQEHDCGHGILQRVGEF
jgi:hypothetical protein